MTVTTHSTVWCKTPDHPQPRAGQRCTRWRVEGDYQEQMACCVPVRRRGHLQDLCEELPWSESPDRILEEAQTIVDAALGTPKPWSEIASGTNLKKRQ